jgi:multiple sugar transport system permease protein
LGNLILQLTIPLGIALLLNQKLKGTHFMRTGVLLPWIVPMVAVAVSMRWMLLPGIGVVNEILQYTMGNQISFLGSRSAAIPTLIILNSWKLFPFGALLILAALQTIPEKIYEAARVDGASPWQQFIHITFPLLGVMIWFMGFLVFVWNFNVFDTIWLTTEGGPGHIMQTLPVLVYRRAFRVFRLGEGATVATIGAAFLMLIGLLYFKFLSPKREVES